MQNLIEKPLALKHLYAKGFKKKKTKKEEEEERTAGAVLMGWD